MRKILFWLHLSAGCVAGIVILMMCVTGVLLAFEQQIVRLAEREYRSEAATASRLRVKDLLEGMRTAGPRELPASITIRADKAAPIEASASGNRFMFLDPYTGQMRGEGAIGLRAFFRSVTDWHRHLAATGEQRDTGRAITGAANLLFFGIVLTGMILWLPRIWSWRHVRPVLWFRGGLQGKARDFNWHNAIGIWSAVPLLAIVVGALVISYPWATNLVYTLAGTEAPPPNRPPQQNRPASGMNPPISLNGIDEAWAVVEAQIPAWQAISLRLPERPSEPWAFTVDLVDRRGRPDQRYLITVDRQSGRVIKTESFADYNAGRKARTWLRWIHTGEAGGLPGQTVAAVATAGGAVLVWTGMALALHRFKAWRSRRRTGRAGRVLSNSSRDISQPASR